MAGKVAPTQLSSKLKLKQTLATSPMNGKVAPTQLSLHSTLKHTLATSPMVGKVAPIQLKTPTQHSNILCLKVDCDESVGHDP